MDFDQLNESDVREEIVSPWLRRLGYRSASEHNILRELSLRYPNSSLGRKNPPHDPPLRGRADYILEADRRVRWVVEAKPPSSTLDVDEVEQAWSYANHPEVRGVYFCLCNGRQFSIYQTHNGPDSGPVLSLNYEQLQEERHWNALVNILAPDSVLRDHHSAVVEFSPPLAPGLRSVARITGGHINYPENSLGNTAISQLQMAIVGGAVQRDEAGQLIALVETRAPLTGIQTLMERLGLTQFEMICKDHILSASPDAPNVFTFNGGITFPAGEQLLDLSTWTMRTLPFNMSVQVKVTAVGILSGKRFEGQITNQALYQGKHRVSFEGRVELFLA